MRVLKAGVFYFALVFGAGFALGPIRTLWAVPRFFLGTRKQDGKRFPVDPSAFVPIRWL